MRSIQGVLFTMLIVAVHSEWSFWSKFTKPWEAFVPNSYNMSAVITMTDSDGDGYISQQEIRDDFTRADLNGDGQVTRCEMVRFYVQQANARPEIVLKEFDYYDLNGDNYITTVDADMGFDLSFADRNIDGKVSTYEYQLFLRKNDLAEQKKLACDVRSLYRLPPKETEKMKRKCALRKMYNKW